MPGRGPKAAGVPGIIPLGVETPTDPRRCAISHPCWRWVAQHFSFPAGKAHGAIQRNERNGLSARFCNRPCDATIWQAMCWEWIGRAADPFSRNAAPPPGHALGAGQAPLGQRNILDKWTRNIPCRKHGTQVGTAGLLMKIASSIRPLSDWQPQHRYRPVCRALGA
jgi:hypothetical protein